jgi:hypothetical protein
MTTPNDSDAERELQRVEEIERNKMQDRTRAIVEAAERLAKAIDVEALNGDEPPPLVVAARLDLGDDVLQEMSSLRQVTGALQLLIVENVEDRVECRANDGGRRGMLRCRLSVAGQCPAEDQADEGRVDDAGEP